MPQPLQILRKYDRELLLGKESRDQKRKDKEIKTRSFTERHFSFQKEIKSIRTNPPLL